MPRRKDGISCTAKSKSTGNRCGNPPLVGLTVCRFHGGATKLSQAKSARVELEELVKPALFQLRQILEDDDTPPHTRLAAAKDILDRMGYKAPERIEVLTVGAVDRAIMELEAELGV